MKARLSFIRSRWLWFIPVLLLVGVVVFFRMRSSSKAEYTFVSPTRESIEETIEVSGKVDAGRKASLKFLGGGKVTSLPVKEGQVVKKWQTIASIDVRDLQKSLKKTLNDYMTERLTFEQDDDDREDLPKNAEVLRLAQQSQLSLDNSVIDVELKDIALRNSSLYSPVDGIVTALPIKIAGVQIGVTDVFEIVDPNSLYFDAEIDEADVGQIRSGMTVRLHLDAYPDSSIDASIDSIGLKAKTSSSTSGGTVFPVTVTIPNPDVYKYRLGMNGTMSIIIKKQDNTLTVPIEATAVNGDKITVKVKKIVDGKEQIVDQEVTTGIEGESRIEILSGLSESDTVAIAQ